ncbi:ROK family protein [Breznakiella homolactica]|uniref:ROK family protein n=1 Tax=Breznakiella homolactica TaxID=2798577 RepID=A0A7T8B8V5_9SPIR|nr:ROK family protein [Breznakiella homolactica]QQO07716.1 ROK family protein [Breznakiella homolactica]
MEKVILGIDIGGTKVRLGLVRDNGEILQTNRFPVKRGPLAEFGEELISQTGLFLTETGYADRINGIGIGAKGHIDNIKNRYASGSLFTGADGYDLCGELERVFGLPAFIDNDLHATVLAEARWGVGRGRNCFAYINVGTGFAVGLIDSGRLIRGDHNFAGEAGNCIFIPTDKRPYIHSLESVVSGGGLDKEVRRMISRFPDSALAAKARTSEPVFSREIFDAYRNGDALAVDLVDDALLMLAYTIINLEHTLNSKLYVFGGGVVADGWFFDKLRGEVERISRESGRVWTAPMEISQLGVDTAGLLGAVSVFLHSRGV